MTVRTVPRLLTFMLTMLVAVAGMAAPVHARAAASPDTEPIVGFWGYPGLGPGVRITVAGGGYNAYYLSGNAPCGASNVGLVYWKFSGSGLRYSGKTLWYRVWSDGRCDLLYGKATMTLTDPTHGKVCGSDPNGQQPFCWTVEKTVNYAGADWPQLFDNAESDWDYSKANAKGGGAYYHQILNLICAATRSGRTTCGPMTSKYANYKWSGQWTYDVFDYYLHDSDQDKRHAEIDQATKTADGVEKSVEALCALARQRVPGWAICDVARPNLWTQADERAAVAGALHFVEHLQPGFYEATLKALKNYHNIAGYQIGIDGLRTEHEALFKYGVGPGFDALVKSGEMSPFAAEIAKKSVPAAATVYREYNILTALIVLNGPLKGIDIYNKTLPKLP